MGVQCAQKNIPPRTFRGIKYSDKSEMTSSSNLDVQSPKVIKEGLAYQTLLPKLVTSDYAVQWALRPRLVNATQSRRRGYQI